MHRTKPTEQIYDYLRKNLIVNLNIIGFIENHPDAEIYIENIDRISGVLVKNGYYNFLYTEDDAFLDSIFSEIFSNDKELGFAGTHWPITEKILKRHQQDWRNPCDLYYLPKENLNIELIKNPVMPIGLKDAEVIDSFYTFRHETSLQQIREDIKRRFSSAVYVNGEIVSWVLLHDDNSMGIMYTKEEFRGKGYAVDVTVDLTSKLLKAGKTPYLQILEKNTQSPGLALKCGFIKAGKCDWFGIIKK